jgi:hypothetical protein
MDLRIQTSFPENGHYEEQVLNSKPMSDLNLILTSGSKYYPYEGANIDGSLHG